MKILLKIIRIILMVMGVIWLRWIVWSNLGPTAYRGHGTSVSTSDVITKPQIENRYEQLKSYCSSLGLASGKEGVLSYNKTTLFEGKHGNMSYLRITIHLRSDNETNTQSVRYLFRCRYPRWSETRSQDYEQLIDELTEIIRNEETLNQQVEPIVTTPVESGSAQSTQAHV